MTGRAVARHHHTRPVTFALAAAAGALAWPAAAQEASMSTQPAAAHLVPADKGYSQAEIAALYQRGGQHVYTGAARATLGMPCGGICAGQVYVLGDGTLGCWDIDGRCRFTGVGHNCYRTYRPEQPIAQGFAVAVRAADGRVTRATLDDAGYDAIEFVGEYPRALVRYRARERAVPPVRVDLEVFSPFIPLDARASAHPATVLRFTVRNPTDGPLEVALAGWLENLAGGEWQAPLTIRRRNRVVAEDGLTSVHMDLVERRPAPPPGAPSQRTLADFESGTYEGWTVTGDAFGTAPATGTHPNQQPVSGFGGRHLVNSFTAGDERTGRMRSAPFEVTHPFLVFRIGGGGHPGQTCLNLVVGDGAVRTATGRNAEQLELRGWDVREYRGRQARLEIVDEARGGWGHINVDDIVLTDALPAELREYDEAALSFGDLALSLVGPGQAAPQWPGREALLAGLPEVAGARSEPVEAAGPVVGTVTSRFTLAPGAAQAVTFIVSWYFPNLHTGQGRMYTNWFRDALDVARQLAGDLERLHAATVRFCDMYYRNTTLPWWLATRLLMPAANLATGTAQWWRNGRFWGWEGVGCCAGTCTHVWNYAQAHAWLFPELARSARTMQDLGAAFEETTGLVGFRSDRNFAADGQAGTILKCYREHRAAPDDTFLRQHWSRIKLALEYLIGHDADENGIIENDRQHNTYDINFVGPNTFVGALYLAALRAGEELARAAGDSDAAARYCALFERGRDWIAANLFNGEYFEQRVPPGDERPWQYGRGCLSDQLFGQTWAHLLGLGYVLPPEQVRSALAAVYKYNFAPDVGPLNAAWPPERWFARPGEPGLFVCTWPRGGRPAEPVRYRDEVWTGIEYQVAAGLAWEGLVDEALLVVHAVDRRYDGARHNPWNEVECGDHYARALASWGVLHALAGFTFDGPGGRLGLAPRITPHDFACFFCAGTGWGNLAQARDARVQVDCVELAWGTLRLTAVETTVPAGARVLRADARVLSSADEPRLPAELDVSWQQDGQRCTVQLARPVVLHAGRQLEVVLQW